MRMLINNTDVSGTMQIDSALNKNSLSAVSNKAVTNSILSVATCNTVADDETKTVTIDGFTLSIGCTLGIIFTNGNSYGETTATTPTYPKLKINNGTSYPICDSRGKYAGKGFCNAGDYIELRYIGEKFVIVNSDIRESVQGESGYTIYSNDFIEEFAFLTGYGNNYNSRVNFPITLKTVEYFNIKRIYETAVSNNSQTASYNAIYIANPVANRLTTTGFYFTTYNESYQYYYKVEGTI